MNRAWVLILLASGALADEVVLRDGRHLSGETRWTSSGLEIQLRHGTIVVPKGDVVSLIEGETPEQELGRRRRALASDDLPGALALARFALEHDLVPQGRGLLVAMATRPVREGEPAAHAQARTRAVEELHGLGFALVDGAWSAPEERGLVQVGGQWVPRQELQRAARLRTAESQEARAEKAGRSAARRSERAEDAVAAAEAEVESARRDLAAQEDKVDRAERARSSARAALGGVRAEERRAETALLAAEKARDEARKVHTCPDRRCRKCPKDDPCRGCDCTREEDRKAAETRVEVATTARDLASRAVAQAEAALGEAERDLSAAERRQGRARGRLDQAEQSLLDRRRYLERAEAAVDESQAQAESARERAERLAQGE